MTRSWPLLLIVALFGLLVVASTWLQELVRQPELPPPPVARLPDSELEGFRIVLHAPDGTPRYRLTGPYLSHYRDDDSSLLREPLATVLEGGDVAWQATAREGVIDDRARRILLRGGAVLEQRPGPDRLALRVTAEQLRIEPPAHLVVSDGPVRISGAGFEIDAAGLHATLVDGDRQVALTGRVRGRHETIR